jgi:hypothetical protein
MDTFLAAVNAVSVVVLAAVTIWYARSTARILSAMQRQAELLALSVEVQAILTEIQATQSSGLGVESLKRIRGLTFHIGEIRSQSLAGPAPPPPSTTHTE